MCAPHSHAALEIHCSCFLSKRIVDITHSLSHACASCTYSTSQHDSTSPYHHALPTTSLLPPLNNTSSQRMMFNRRSGFLIVKKGQRSLASVVHIVAA